MLSFVEHFVPFWNDWCSFVPFVCLLFSVYKSEDRTEEEEPPFFGSERMERISRHLVLAHFTKGYFQVIDVLAESEVQKDGRTRPQRLLIWKPRRLSAESKDGRQTR